MLSDSICVFARISTCVCECAVNWNFSTTPENVENLHRKEKYIMLIKQELEEVLTIQRKRRNGK